MRALLLAAAALSLAACDPAPSDPYIPSGNNVVVDEPEIDCDAEPNRPACRIRERGSDLEPLP